MRLGNVTYEEYISSQKKSCSKVYEIRAKQGDYREKCEEQCDKEETCQFYIYTSNNWCVLYSSCNDIRDTLAIGSTFKKLKDSGLTFSFIQTKCQFYYLYSRKYQK